MQARKTTCKSKGNDVCLCPLEGVMETIAKRWALQIVAVLGNHTRIRFSAIMTTLDGISPKSLTDRLKDLEKAGLAKREAFAEIPPRVEYSLTRDGEDLWRALMPLMEWASSKQTGASGAGTGSHAIATSP